MLKVEQVSKKYGNKTVLNKISFNLKKGDCFGLLGSNGAGKSTTIRIILGILNKSDGKVTYNDQEVSRKSVNFGYLPEERGLYPKTKVIDQLLYFAALKNMPKDKALKEINELAKILKIEEYLNMEAEKLSKGNQQKVQILIAFQNDPELIILDEPFSGLDPVNSLLVADLIKKKKKDKIIVLSSHQMSIVEEFCTDILILDRGITKLKGNLINIKNEYSDSKLEVVTIKDIDEKIKKAKLDIINKVGSSYTLSIKNKDDAYKLLKLLDDNDQVIKFEILKPNLNDIFISTVGGKEND
jgi:ABC transporter related protein